jgi:hypothetical protein
MSVIRWYEGVGYHFASKHNGKPATYAGYAIGWGDDGIAPHPEYPLRVVARKDEPSLSFSMRGRTFLNESEALAFVQRARSNFVLLDAKGRFVGAVYRSLSHPGSWSRQILLGKWVT